MLKFTTTSILTLALALPVSSSLAQRQSSDARATATTTTVTAATATAATLPQPTPDSSVELPRGRIVEKIPTKADAAQSYALYLPSNYTPEKRWPILYAFDPLARGGLPVERFREAAERHGWIVAGSNNSRNGALKPSLEAADAMWRDTHGRLSIDERRVYTTGFSGGARLAVRVGLICHGCVAGVIACGAGFPADVAPPSTPLLFAVYGLVGTNDFNFPEMKRLDAALDKLDSAAHRLEVFDGAHSWTSTEACADAVEWMELQAVRTGRRARVESFVDELWRKRLSRARALEESQKFYDAYVGYRSLAVDFRGLRDVAEFERRAAQLRGAKEVKRALEEEEAQIKRQQLIAGELFDILQRRQDPETRAVASVEFRNRLAGLKKAAASADDTGGRRVARRALNQVFAQFYEGASNLRQRGENYSLAASTLEVAAEIAPDNPQVLYELACTYALNREKRKALDALRKAVEQGFNDADAIAADKSLDSLRGEAAYRELVEKLSRKKKSSPVSL